MNDYKELKEIFSDLIKNNSTAQKVKYTIINDKLDKISKTHEKFSERLFTLEIQQKEHSNGNCIYKNDIQTIRDLNKNLKFLKKVVVVSFSIITGIVALAVNWVKLFP
jgi:hypothetical protein